MMNTDDRQHRSILQRIAHRAMFEEIFYTLKEAQVLIEEWRLEYNTFRPHSSLKYRPPAPEAWLH
jgi:transposase InsO family protein